MIEPGGENMLALIEHNKVRERGAAVYIHHRIDKFTFPGKSKADEYKYVRYVAKESLR